MAKKRASIFESGTSEKEIKSAAKKIQEKSIDKIPDKKSVEAAEPVRTSEKRTTVSKTEEASKPISEKKVKKKDTMNLYVGKSHHQTAKFNAFKRGMKLGEYIEWLIDSDKDA